MSDRTLSDSQVDVACRMRAAGVKLTTIRDHLGCTIGAVVNVLYSPKYVYHRSAASQSVNGHGMIDDSRIMAARVCVPVDVERKRDQRWRGYMLRDLTGLLMGDPPIGFSALDLKRAAA